LLWERLHRAKTAMEHLEGGAERLDGFCQARHLLLQCLCARGRGPGGVGRLPQARRDGVDGLAAREVQHALELGDLGLERLDVGGVMLLATEERHADLG
jgi:hypothetical protein